MQKPSLQLSRHLGRLVGRRGEASQNPDLGGVCPEFQGGAGEIAGESVQLGDDAGGALLDSGVADVSGHDGHSGDVGDSLSQPSRASSWKSRLRFHKGEGADAVDEGIPADSAAVEDEKREPDVGSALRRLSRPAARLVNRNEPGTLEHAVTAAVNALGVKQVAHLTGLSKSAIYAGCDPNDARHFRSLSFDAALTLGALMSKVGARSDVFALPFLRQSAEMPVVAHSSHLLHQAAHVSALYGRAAASLCKIFDRLDGARRPARLDPRDRDEAVAAIDATIEGLTALRSQLLNTTSLPPLPIHIPLEDPQ